MATSNRDFPRGFWPAYTKHGGPPALNRYYTTGTAAIYIGDVVRFPNTNNAHGVTPITSSSGEADIVGVAATFTTSAAAGSTDADAVEVYVYDDLVNTVFIAQHDSSVTTEFPSSTSTMKIYKLNVGTASSALQTSNMEIQGSTDANGGIYVIDKVDRPDNAWGGWVDLYCQIVQGMHRPHNTTGAINAT